MTNRYDEIGKFTRAMTELKNVRDGLDTSVLSEIDKDVLEGFDSYSKLFREYCTLVLCDMWKDMFNGMMGKVKE